jgi:hypothetical protein
MTFRHAKLQHWRRWVERQVSDSTTVITTPFTAGDAGFLLVDDDTIGGVALINLPPTASYLGKVYHIKKIGSTGAVTVDGDSTETIDDALTAVLNSKYESVKLLSDGSNWHIL